MLANQRGLAALASARQKKRQRTLHGQDTDDLDITQQTTEDLACSSLPDPDRKVHVTRVGSQFVVSKAALSGVHRNALTLKPKESSVSIGHTIEYPIFRQSSHSPDCFQVPRFYAQMMFNCEHAQGPQVAVAKRGDVGFNGVLTARQADIITRTVQSMRSRYGAMLVLPCGTGKTVLAIRIMCELGLKTMVLVHTQCLMDQWKSRIAQFAPSAKVGSLQGDRVRAVGACINSATREELLLTGLFEKEDGNKVPERIAPVVRDIKRQLKKLGLRLSGNRDELVARLREFDASNGTSHFESLHVTKATVLDKLLGGVPYDTARDLAAQFSARGLKKALVAELVRVYDGRDYDVVIGMVQSVSKKNYHSSVLRYGLLVVDEAHHICAKMMSESMFKIESSYVLGLSATPKRTDELGYALPWLLGPVAYALKAEYPDAFYVPVEYNPTQPSMRNEIMGGYGNLLIPSMVTRMIQDETRNQLIVSKVVDAIKEGRHVIVISERVNHLDSVQALLHAALYIDHENTTVYIPEEDTRGAYRNAFFDPTPTPNTSNQSIMKFTEYLRSSGMQINRQWKWVCDKSKHRIAIGQYKGGMDEQTRRESASCQVILATYQMCSEGLDIPILDTLVFATPRSNVEQSVGRILRSHPDKKFPMVYDIVDTYSIFEKMYYKRLRIYRSMCLKRRHSGDEKDK